MIQNAEYDVTLRIKVEAHESEALPGMSQVVEGLRDVLQCSLNEDGEIAVSEAAFRLVTALSKRWDVRAIVTEVLVLKGQGEEEG